MTFKALIQQGHRPRDPKGMDLNRRENIPAQLSPNRPTPSQRWRVLLLPGFDLFLFSDGELPGDREIAEAPLIGLGMVVMMGVVSGWSC